MIRLGSSVARRLTRRHTIPLALACALALPTLAWAARAVALVSLSLSPAEVTVGSSATGTVTIDAVPTKGSVTVQLTSRDPAVATVPTSVSFSGFVRTTSRSFAAQSVAAGCSEINAQLDNVTRTALLTVQPTNPTSSPVGLGFVRTPGGSSITAAAGGSTVYGVVQLIGVPTGTHAVQLASNSAVARVPSSVNVTVTVAEGAGTAGSASFPITTTVTDRTICPVISATFSSSTRRALLRVVTIGG